MQSAFEHVERGSLALKHIVLVADVPLTVAAGASFYWWDQIDRAGHLIILGLMVIAWGFTVLLKWREWRRSGK